MKNLKYLVIGLFAFAIVGVSSVSAVEFSEILSEITGEDGYTITADGDDITFEGETWIGQDGRITINEGSANVKLDVNTGIVDIVTSQDSKAVINEGKQFIMQLTYGGQTYRVRLTISEGATLDINGTLAVPSGSEGVVTNNGTININENGALEVRSAGMYGGSGITNVYGDLAIYCTDIGNIGVSSFNLYDGANIYSQVDISDLVQIGETAAEGYTTSVVESTGENAKEYTSITDSVGTVKFDYSYNLLTVEISDEETDDPTLGDSTGEGETPTTPDEENPTTPSEDDVTTPEETPEVPQTYDGAVVSAIVGACALAVVVIAVILAKKKILFN